MLEYNDSKKVVAMSLADLEHCGFEHGLFEFELETAGMPGSASWPDVLVVSFAGGHAISNKTGKEALEARHQAGLRARALVDKMLG
jgi:hypothetical protein